MSVFPEARELNDFEICMQGEIDYLKSMLKGSKNMHSCTLACLNGVLEQLNEGTDRNVLIEFIKTFLRDSKQEGR